MSFFSEIARFAIKGLIAVVMVFLGVLAIIAAFAIGGSAGGGDGGGVAGVGGGSDEGIAEAYDSVVRGALNDEEDNKLAIISVTGLIDNLNTSESNPVGWFENDFVTYGYSIKETFEDLIEADEIKGVLLLMNTPGGTINGSKAITDGIDAYRAATDKPVFAYVKSLSASGGMWSMAAADWIIADEGALVGSIGVTAGSLLYYDDPIAVDQGILFGGVETRGGVKATSLTAGEGKDFGNPYRAPSEKELAVMQANLDDLYQQFRDHISARRGLTDAQVLDLGALVYAPRRAQALGLVDAVADFDAALAQLAEKAGLGEDFAAVRRSAPDLPWFAGLVQALRPTAATDSPIPAGVRVCNRLEPLVISAHYARQYPGC